MDSQGAGFAFDAAMDFNTFSMPQQQQSFLKPSEDNTSASFFFGDEGIDTTTGFSHLDTMNPALLSTPQQTSFDMQHSLTLDNTSATASAWDAHLTPNIHQSLNAFPPTPVQSFDSLYQPSTSALGKRPLQLDAPEFPQAKRHETADFTLFSPFASTATASSSWALDAQPTPASSIEVGLSDEAADMCATWFNKYNVLPSDRHIDSLSQLTGESSDAIRSWFGQLLKQGMGSQDSAYKSQTGLGQQRSFWTDSFSTDIIQTSPQQALLQTDETSTPEAQCSHDTTTVNQPTSLRGSKKRCTPTEDRSLLARDANKIYQCTRKCGKRYGRKCDWKRNEEEGYPCKSWVCSLCKSDGVENVKPCFRKYHFVQHFRNIHPDMNADDFEEASVVCSETEFPRNCGFCRHRFVSRQERIDHIADHFKQGKCMLEWNEEEDNGDSDNADDDDDRPSGDDFDSSKPSYQPPGSGSRGSSSGNSSYYNGSGGGSSGAGGQQSHGDFFQFQLSQFNENSGIQSSCANQHIQPADDLQLQLQQLQRPNSLSASEEQGSLEGSQSTQRPTPHTKQYVPAARDNTNAMAGDAVTRAVTEQCQTGLQMLQKDESRTETHQYSKRSKVALTSKNTTLSENLTDLSPNVSTACQSSVTATPACQSSVIATMPSSTNRARLRLSDDDHLDAPSARQSITATNAPSVSVKDGHTSMVVSEQKVAHTSVRAPSRTRLIEKQTPQNISITPQSFLSVRLLGTGGFSTVDEVVHRETSLVLARKTLRNRDQTALDELQKEVDMLQKLRHPHVVRFLGAYSKGDKMSILLSPVADTTLQLWLERVAVQQPANLSEKIVKMFGCLTSSIRYLHEQRPVIKHMDIKPQNVLIVDGDTEFPHVVLCDFGISSVEELSDGVPKALTRRYVAPEVFNGFTRKQAADIWSLGCVIAEMASVAYSQNNPSWLEFREEFSGRNDKYYWQDVQGLQSSLSHVLDQASTQTEQTVLRTVKTMLSSEPASRPDAAVLTMIFTPASCCLNWPNDKAIYPGPNEEFDGVDLLSRKDCGDCTHSHAEINEESEDSLAHANQWLEECSHTHDACRVQTSTNAKTLPTRLVDIRPDGQEQSFVRIVNSASIDGNVDQLDYVALSHVWSSEHVTLTTEGLQSMLTELPLQALPTAVNTAISTAHRLGYRYIWVDSLCIIQDSEDDKRKECADMASVFRNAALTVVLDQLITDLVGDKPVTHDLTLERPLSSTSKTSTSSDMRLPASAALPALAFTTPGFAWDTRAWALQERLLSRRFLHLGEQMYWECNSLKASETFPRGLSPLVWEKVHSRSISRTPNRSTVPAMPLSSASVMCREKEILDKKPVSTSPRLLRNCQWIKKQGGASGDSMEAAQTSLRFEHAQASLAERAQLALPQDSTSVTTTTHLIDRDHNHDMMSYRALLPGSKRSQTGAMPAANILSRLPLGPHVFFDDSNQSNTVDMTTQVEVKTTRTPFPNLRNGNAADSGIDTRGKDGKARNGRREIEQAGQLDQHGSVRFEGYQRSEHDSQVMRD